MYKQDLELNNLHWLIRHKTQPNQTSIYLSISDTRKENNEKSALIDMFMLHKLGGQDLTKNRSECAINSGFKR